MRSASFVAVACAVVGCSQPRPDRAYTKASDLPAKFYLDCSAPRPTGNQLPEGTVDGFKVTVDLPAKKFSVPWLEGQQPIEEVYETEIVFVDWYVERGLDNNSMETKMRFDVQSGELIYRNSASARMPLDRSFVASCKVVGNA